MAVNEKPKVDYTNILERERDGLITDSQRKGLNLGRKRGDMGIPPPMLAELPDAPPTAGERFSGTQLTHEPVEDGSASQTWRNALQGPTMAFGDELEAGIRTGFGTIGDYQETKAEINSEISQYQKDYPGRAAGAQAAASMVLLPFGGGTVAANKFAGTALNTMIGVGKAGGVGAVYGGLYGAGSSEAKLTEGELGKFVEDTGEGAMFGGALGAGLGAAIPAGAFILGSGFNALRGVVVRNETILHQLRLDPTNSRTVGYMLNAAKKRGFEYIPQVKAALKHGWQESVVAMTHGADMVDQFAFRRMNNTLKKNIAVARRGQINKPSDVLGETVGKRIKFLAKDVEDTGKLIDPIAKKEFANTTVDLQGSVGNFNKYISENNLGVVDNAGNIAFPIGTDLADNAQASGLLKKVINRINGATEMNGYEAHKLKQFIDTAINYEHKLSGSVDPKVNAALTGLRKEIDGMLTMGSQKYKDINTRYSHGVQARNDFYQNMGKNDLAETKYYDAYLGSVSSKMDANRDASINGLAGYISKYADKQTQRTMRGDIPSQRAFLEEQTRLFGSSAVVREMQANSAGVVTAGQHVGEGLLAGAMGHPFYGVIKTTEGLFGMFKTPQNAKTAQNAMQRLLIRK